MASIYNEWKHINVGDVSVTAHIAVSLHPSENVGSVVVTECWAHYGEHLESYLEAERLNKLDVDRANEPTHVLLRRAIADADCYFFFVELLAQKANELLQSERAAEKQMAVARSEDELPF